VDSGRPIAPALRAILGQCLDPDPARRYRRALELAEDLDRWRTDRPLAYADEPFWGEVVPRWLRLKRRMLIVAAVSLLAVGLAMTALMLLGSNRLLRQDFEAGARNQFARWLDYPETGAFGRTQRANAPMNSWEPDDPEDFEVARRALRDYGVLGEGDLPAAGDWRLRDGVRYLAPADREDLETWLMECAYRYCRALEDRPDSPDDWRRALDVLDRAGGTRSIRAWAPLSDRLAARLRLGTVPRARTPAPEWLDEHLLGFAAQCQSGSVPGSGDPNAPAQDRRSAIEQALGHYDKVLAIRPASFWGHYRAAAACFGLGRPSEAAHHLVRCLERRPGNPAIQMQLAGVLDALEDYQGALEFCDRALERAPGYAELYRSRAYARLPLRQTVGLDDEVKRFEMLSQILPRELWDGAAAMGPVEAAGPIASVFRGLADSRLGPARGGGRGKVVGVKPEEIEARANLAERLRQAELFPLAAAEVEKILAIQPDHIPARMMRVEQAIRERRFDAARSERDAVLDHPGLEDYVRGRDGALAHFFEVTELYLKAAKPAEAQKVAERARDLAIRARRDRGGAHYNLARVYAVLGATNPSRIEDGAQQLFRAFIAHPEHRRHYAEASPWFDPVRASIDQALGRKEDPAEVRRRLASSSAKAADRVADR
jgi:tetratricopeptide (TPR) repeat protein